MAGELLGHIRRACNQLLAFCDFAGKVDPTNNVSERALRPSAIHRMITNGSRAKWAADAEVALRSTVDTARPTGKLPFRTILCGGAGGKMVHIVKARLLQDRKSVV